jgi:hypothetical protein
MEKEAVEQDIVAAAAQAEAGIVEGFVAGPRLAPERQRHRRT